MAGKMLRLGVLRSSLAAMPHRSSKRRPSIIPLEGSKTARKGWRATQSNERFVKAGHHSIQAKTLRLVA